MTPAAGFPYEAKRSPELFHETLYGRRILYYNDFNNG